MSQYSQEIMSYQTEYNNAKVLQEKVDNHLPVNTVIKQKVFCNDVSQCNNTSL